MRSVSSNASRFIQASISTCAGVGVLGDGRHQAAGLVEVGGELHDHSSQGSKAAKTFPIPLPIPFPVLPPVHHLHESNQHRHDPQQHFPSLVQPFRLGSGDHASDVENRRQLRRGSQGHAVEPCFFLLAELPGASVNVSGAPSGIVIQNNSGSFIVNGDGSTTGGILDRDGSGGVLANTTSDAVRLTNGNNITLRQMNLNSPGDTIFPNLADNERATGEHGVEAIGGSNIIVSAVLIDSPAASAMIAINATGTRRLNSNSLVTNTDNPATHGLTSRTPPAYPDAVRGQRYRFH